MGTKLREMCAGKSQQANGAIGSQHKGDEMLTRAGMCSDPELQAMVLDQLVARVRGKLENFETPRNIRLVSDQWTPENGLLTSAMKIKRKPIQNKYSHLIDEMYEETAAKRANKA